MQKFTLKNGLKVLYQKTNSNSATVNVLVKTGSNNESNGISGISHFIEHMLFEGTKKRPNSRLIANEIEKLGGIFNAYTSGEVTCYYAKVMNKDIEKAFEILSDIILNPLFENKIIGKERKVIMKELHMVIDDPRFYQWRLFQKELFKGHPAANPTLGTSASLKSMSREKILNYYRKYYSADKMVISVAGNIDGVNSMAEKYFSDRGKSQARGRQGVSGGQVPAKDFEFSDEVAGIWHQYQTAMKNFQLDQVIEIIRKLNAFADSYVERQKPWELAKSDPDQLVKVIYNLLEIIRHLALMIYPVMPTVAEKIMTNLGQADWLERDFKELIDWGGLEPGTKVTKSEALFPRLEK